ncbi:hypothetical protein M501DRAFT_1018598 [Patellaria atrata CBS 101060]|uniref:VLRF1 domain-containing protein n=1 Tax=Patellaria atrata CBS 101060 TaxID=1346257 RepID=A0A9P4S5W9_9PEZI|nr:hypothetical protein M501DRAFT_1018598 [Patellaria atrata CBS 101060]
MASEVDDLLRRPLYVFDLPEELLVTLTLKEQTELPVNLIPSEPLHRSSRISETVEAQDAVATTATSCNLCNLAFPNLQEQRSHVRSDLHGYNLKQKMKRLQPVSEYEFEKLVEDLDESISGSDSSDSKSDEDDGIGQRSKETTLSALLKKQAKISAPDFDEFASKKRKRGSGKPPLLWFTSPGLPEDTSLGIYRAIFSDAEQEDASTLVETIRKKQLAPTAHPKKPIAVIGGGVSLPTSNIGPHYFLCMIGGGHFAAMVVALAPKSSKSHTGERAATVLAHKTFHRYTTRRKQGGSQSANDNSKGNAHSAGSSLRRYNEAALTNEVRELLSEWKSLIDAAEFCFIRATGSTNRRTLFGPYEGQVLRNNDPRNRGFPFSTRRATQAELMRSFVELTRIKVSNVDQAALQQQQQTSENSSTPTPSASSSKPSKPTLSAEEQAAALHTSQIQALIRRSKAPALLTYLTTNSLSPNFLFHPRDTKEHYHAPAPLHLAASLNSTVIVSALLLKAAADPTLRNLEDRTAFEIAGDRPTRDAFRVARSVLGEETWDWVAAAVPSPITKAEADARDAREREEEEREETQRRTTEMERLRVETEREEQERRERKVGKGRKLGAPVVEKTGAEKREEEARGMTPEMRMRLERERRARAAEERLKRLQR